MKLMKHTLLFLSTAGLLSSCSQPATTETASTTTPATTEATTPTAEATTTAAKPSETIVGKWQFDNMDMGRPIPADKKAQWDAMMTEMKKTTTYEFTASGEVTFNAAMGGKSETQTGTWKLSDDGKKITTNIKGKEKTEDVAELTPNKLSFKTDDGHGTVSTITFVK